MNKSAYTFLLLVTVALAAANTAVAQKRSPTAPPAQVQTELQIQSNESFELNIPEKHFTAQDFAASTSVGLAPANPGSVSVQVGVAVRARTITVDLHRVTGTVRFRGSVQQILDLINSHQRIASPP